ncbi:MAG: acylneuraminate cytidylyltransferase [Candidatus Omnitrophota bacterium]|nr:MAG: acylneuraminate cytidylyltransferase [Candidatus Omnitrophota bacterium]
MNKKIVAFIPARGQSKGIPKKNIKNFAGKPLIYWSALSASLCDLIDRVYVSTEDEEIKNTVLSFNLPKVEVISRTKKSATDKAPTELAVLEFAQKYQFEIMVLLQATSPLTTYKDIENALKLYFEKKYDSLLSVVRQKRFIWDFDSKTKKWVSINYDYKKRPRRQNFEGYFVENGAIYIMKKEGLLRYKNRLYGNIGVYEMPEYTYNELDSELDWQILENLAYKVKEFYLTYWLKNIKLLGLDVDGVLTDGGVYHSKDGEEFLKFNRIDGKGIELVRKSGIDVVVISSENLPIIRKRCDKLRIKEVYTGVRDKLAVLKKTVEKKNLKPSEIAFIGDDVQDIPVMEWAGFSAAPSNALDIVKIKANYVCKRKGGEGAVREVCNLIISTKNVYSKNW